MLEMDYPKLINETSFEMKLNDVITELHRFSDAVLTFKEPVNINRIQDFENEIGITLPNDYKVLLKRFNGVNLAGKIVYGIGKSSGEMSLDEAYFYEHNEVANPMFKYLIPFSPDGAGSHYCFDVREVNVESCNIIFWQYDYHYNEEDAPEITHPSFTAWLKEVFIDGTLGYIDYEGNLT